MEKGDIVYSVRGVNAVKGRVFDRLGIVKSTIEEVVDKEIKDNGQVIKWHYIRTSTNEIITTYFKTLEAAKQYLKDCWLKCTNPRYLANKNKKICIIDNSKKYIQLSLFDI